MRKCIVFDLGQGSLAPEEKLVPCRQPLSFERPPGKSYHTRSILLVIVTNIYIYIYIIVLVIGIVIVIITFLFLHTHTYKCVFMYAPWDDLGQRSLPPEEKLVPRRQPFSFERPPPRPLEPADADKQFGSATN